MCGYADAGRAGGRSRRRRKKKKGEEDGKIERKGGGVDSTS